ncbi:unnamed protein product [Lampetra planeri]
MSKINRMPLLDYPVPELDVTLKEVDRVLQLILSSGQYNEFKRTLEQQGGLLEDAQQKLASSAAGQENWVTEKFKDGLLSCAGPIPTSTTVPVVMPMSRAQSCSQLQRAAAILWAAAKLYSEPLLLEGDVPLEHTQQSEVFAASRLPGRNQDALKVKCGTRKSACSCVNILQQSKSSVSNPLQVYPDSLHAIITCVGGVFPIEILQRSTGGSVAARSFTDIYNQLAKVVDRPRAGKENNPTAVCSLSALDRKTWASIREEILVKGGAAAASLGMSLMEGVECGVGNVYAQDQLAVTYLGKTDKVRIVLNGKGTFAQALEKLQQQLKVNLQIVMLLALRYAIACQMGALECLLTQGKTGQMNGETHDCAMSTSSGKTTVDSTTGMSSDYTLVIHGGAGEEMMHNPQVNDVIEFALQTALTLGSQVLQDNGGSLDAVQRAVEALEDCFLFNAGKGAVFNKDGKNEMEATIVDGNAMRSGSVACVQSVKNPIKAARCVMDKSPHSLIVGDGAEEFLQGLEEKGKNGQA